MSEIQHLPTSSPIIASGSPSVNALYSNGENPWSSVEEFLTSALEDTLVDLKKCTTILVDINGTPTELWNRFNNTEFIVKQADISSDVYVIEASEWGLTEGLMEQDSSNHYTDAQYDKMYQNGIGISNAIKFAYAQGFSRVSLERGTYCFCASTPDNLIVLYPQIFLNDLSNFTFDLNGSTLRLCIDDTAYSKYYLNHSKDTHLQYTYLICPSYCRDITICNGTLIGDRFTRAYRTNTASEAEQTYGIMIGAGSRNVTIKDIEFREFMGDGVCGAGVTYYKVDNASQITTYNSLIGYKTIGTATQQDYINDDLTTNSNIRNCSITGFIDTEQLYTSDLTIKNRAKDKKDRIFQINFALGYTKMSPCYPDEMYILTYSGSSGIPLRRISAAYLTEFRLTSEEKFIRILFTHEDNLYNEYNSTKSYEIGDKIVRFMDNVVIECESKIYNNTNTFQNDWSRDQNNWKFIRVKGVGISASYDSSKTYTQGERVTFNIGNAGVCYRCKTATTGNFDSSKWEFEETERTCVSSVNYDTIAVFEFISSDVKIEKCRFINNHRGGVANLPHNSIIENCQFSKHYKRAGDGFPAPNPGSNLACTTPAWSTHYHINIEDWYSYNVKVKDCRFEPGGDFNKQVTFGCFTAEMTGCTGFVSLNIMSSTHVNIHDNVFDGFNLSTQSANLTVNRDTNNRAVTRDIIFDNNKVLSGFWNAYGMEGQRVRITNNFIYEDFLVAPIDETMFGTNADYVFSNNTLVDKKQKHTYTDAKRVTINANVVNGSVIKTKNGVNLYSPMSGNMQVDAKTVFFRESLDERKYNGLNITTTEAINIFINSDPNGVSKKVVRFTDCNFNNVAEYTNPIYFEGCSGRSISQEFDIYFDHCSFTTKSQFDLFAIGRFYIEGDKYNLYFNNCTFDTVANSICNREGVVELKKITGCSATKPLYCNGVVVNMDAVVDAYTKSESDSKYQPVGDYLVDSDLAGYQTVSEMPISTEAGSAQGPDFYLVDESGNALAAFEGGHIRTEKFNSAEVYSKSQCDARYAPINSGSGFDVSDLVTNLKTINGNSIVGSGDLSITATPPDMSNYLTRTQIEGSFLRANDVATINGRSIVNGGNIEITGGGSIDTSGTSTGIYPTYQIHCYNPVASPQVALKKYITDFNFELGKSYRIDVDFGGENPYTGLTITLSHSDGSEGSQQVFGNFGQSIHQIFTADDDYDKMYIYYGGACDCNFTISFEDTIQNLVNGPIASDALVNKNNVANVENVLNLKRKFNTPYKFACMGDSITSDQVSGIGTLVSSYLGCQLIGNFACGSATLTNSADFVYSVAVANNTGTPYNTLTNQVVRLLQRTTPLGEQITWTHQETKENYSIPTNVATGLGFTEDIPDIIYIAIGVNDSSANIGDDLDTVITQSYSELTKRTFASALRWAIETLRCVYPKVQIFVATPLFTGLANSVENFSKATVLLKRKAILESCIANGVYCIDSTMKAGYTNQISNINSQGIHPRSYNKCMIAKFIQKEIYNNYIPEIPAEEIIY